MWKMNAIPNLLTALQWLFGIFAVKDPSASLLKSTGELVFGGWLSSSGAHQQVTP